LANVAPQLCVNLYNSFKQSDMERARQLQTKLLSLNELLIRRYNQISAIKEAMNLAGKPAGYPRGPALPLEEDARTEIKKVLSMLGVA